MSRRTWIGLDAALSAFGWAVMNRELGGQPTVLSMGVWRTRTDAKAGKFEDRARRVREIIVNLRDLAVEFKPQEAYVESPAFKHGEQSYLSVAASGRVRGVVDTVCVLLGIDLAEVRPDVVKQAVTGRRDASKEQVARMLESMYRLGVDEKRDLNSTDALAVAHVGAHRYGGAVNVSSGVVSYRDVESDLDGLDF